MRIYIKGMDKLPENCQTCWIRQLADSLHPATRLCPIIAGDRAIPVMKERSPNCPLRAQRQPNRFDTVVQILKDADFRQEDDLTEEDEYIRMIADMICQIFKDGPYDEEETMDEIVSNYKETKRICETLKNEYSERPSKEENEIKIKVKAEGLEETEEGIRSLADSIGECFPGAIRIQKIENCEVSFHFSTYKG